MGTGYPIPHTLASQKGLTGGEASAILCQMSEINHKEWAPGLVALYVGPGYSSDELMLRNSYDHHERVSWPKDIWCTDPPSVRWMPDSGWSGPVWVGTSEEYRALRGRAESPTDLLRIAREDAQNTAIDSTVVVFGEEYIKASDSRGVFAQAEAQIETLRQEAHRTCIAAERFGIYQSRADVAAESLASKMVDLRAEFEAYKRRTADSRLQIQEAMAAMNALQGERDLYRDDLGAIRSVLGEPGGSADLCVDKIRAYQEEIDDLRAEIEAHKRAAPDAHLRLRRDLRDAEESSSTWCDRFNNEREQMDRIRAALGERFSRESTAGMVAEIERLRAETDACKRAPRVARCLADIEPGIYVSANGDIWRSERKGTIRCNLGAKGRLWTTSDSHDPVRTHAPFMRIG